MHHTLAARAGESVSFTVDTIHMDSDVVFAIVTLPDDLPYCGEQPYVKLRVHPQASGSVVRSLMVQGGTEAGIDLPEPIVLRGSIEMETGLSRTRERVRQPRHADEAQGRWVHVKKHSSLCCAVVNFPSSAVRNSVLGQCSSGVVPQLRGISLDVKPQREKEKILGGTRTEVPNAIFVGWRTPNADTRSITAADLQAHFDRMATPFMGSSSAHDAAGLADALLRGKGVPTTPQSVGTGSGAEEIVVLRLTRMARSPQVTSLLLNSPVLEACRRRAIDAGGDLMPSWAAGAKLLVLPEHQAQVAEAGVALQHHHVVAYSGDVELLKQALAEMPCRQRPKISHEKAMAKRRPPPRDEEPLFVVECTLRTNSSLGPNSSLGL